MARERRAHAYSYDRRDPRYVGYRAETIEEADESEDSEIWRNSRACEFGTLLQAHTSEPAQQPLGDVFLKPNVCSVGRLTNRDEFSRLS